jgi:hypothetical protein
MVPMVRSAPFAHARRILNDRFECTDARGKQMPIPPATARSVPFDFGFCVAERHEAIAQRLRGSFPRVCLGCSDPTAPQQRRMHGGRRAPALSI